MTASPESSPKSPLELFISSPLRIRKSTTAESGSGSNTAHSWTTPPSWKSCKSMTKWIGQVCVVLSVSTQAKWWEKDQNLPPNKRTSTCSHPTLLRFDRRWSYGTIKFMILSNRCHVVAAGLRGKVYHTKKVTDPTRMASVISNSNHIARSMGEKTLID